MVGYHGETRRGSVAPSYSQIVLDKSKDVGMHCFKKPMEMATEAINMEKLGKNRPHEQEGD